MSVVERFAEDRKQIGCDVLRSYEEQDWFPKVREGLSRTALRDIGVEV